MPMWAIKNRTPYAVGRTWGRDKDGVHEWIVVVKGSYDVPPGKPPRLADAQMEPLLLPIYNGADGASSLRYEADLVSPKPTTDIVVNGTAYAPGGRPAPEFTASISVGPVHKRLRVVGRRRWLGGAGKPRLSAAEPVAAVPIVYERAFGGFDRSDPDVATQRMDPRNPVGCGLVPGPDADAPNFELPGRELRDGPAGFGAIASHWSPRRELQGTYDARWQRDRFPLLPADWDARSLQCAPVDQRPEAPLRGGEPVVLENLTPSGTWTFSLPRAHLRLQTRLDGRTHEHAATLATVILEPDLARVIMVWHSSLPVRNNGDYLDETIVSEKRQVR